MRLIVAADHSGFHLKDPIINALRSWGHEVLDVGTFTPQPRVDFPDLAEKVCPPILSGEVDRGIMVCGSGIGACIAANKFTGIRAGVCHDIYSAHQSVEHDNANVLCLGAQIVGEKLAYELLRAFVDARFTEEEYFRQRDVKLAALERRLLGK
ncbi:MAG: ribose 5-phosphate isomerase B [Chloroflexota bacterium]